MIRNWMQNFADTISAHMSRTDRRKYYIIFSRRRQSGQDTSALR